MIDNRKPPTLKKLLSPGTLTKNEIQKALKEKVPTNNTGIKQPSGNSAKAKVDSQLPVQTLKKKKQEKEPLTENEVMQIRAKHEAIDKAFALLHERFPHAFNLDVCKSLHVPLIYLQELFKGELSKTVVRRASLKGQGGRSLCPHTQFKHNNPFLNLISDKDNY
jgi:hypothetical protein